MTYSKTSPETIQKLFSKIAARYDLCNKVLSFNLHKRWNRKLVKELLNTPAEKILDVCAGTGDIAFEFSHHLPKSVEVHLLDFSNPMLEIAKIKAKKGGLPLNSFAFIQGDATELPFQENLFSQVSIAYGFRNIENPLKCMNELFRVLKKGGTLGILELTRPENFFVRPFHSIYLKFFVPLIGGILTSDRDAYEYLSHSIKQFHPTSFIKKGLEDVGFQEVKIIPLHLGIASIVIAKKGET